MTLFKPAEKAMAFAKVGLHGPAGSGKTRTAWEIAKGLHSVIKSKKPIAMIDTETGSHFIQPLADKAKIKLVVSRSRAFKDLISGSQEAEGVADILIIDAITHCWLDLIESYKKKLNTKTLTFQAWGTVKPMWAEFSTWYVSSNLHVIVCGRAGDVWDYFENEEGKMELYKVGTRMKAEKEFGYEASLLIEMEQLQNPEAAQEYRAAKAKRDKEIAAKKMRDDRQWIRRAWILKDRADILDGQFFDNPTFKDFAPHWDYLNIGGEHHPLDAGDSQELFNHEGKPDWKREKEQIQIALEELDAELTKCFPSSKTEDKQGRIVMCEYLFNTSSKTAIEHMGLTEMKEAVDLVRQANKDSTYREGIINKIFTYDKRMQEKKEAEKDVPLDPGKPETVTCPKTDEKVKVDHCNQFCKQREGCPVFG